MKKVIVLFAIVNFYCNLLNAQCLTTKTIVDNCVIANNDSLFWNNSYWFDTVNKIHDLAEDSIKLSIEITDTCGNLPAELHFVLLLDLNNDGTPETAITDTTNTKPGFIFIENSNNPGHAGGLLRRFDFRQVGNQELYVFSLEQTVAGNIRTGQIIWKPAGGGQSVQPKLPLGKHLIRWYSGNEVVFEDSFRVKDCLPPTLTCKPFLEAQIFVFSCGITIWNDDIIDALYDNVTPRSELDLSSRRKGSGNNFPLDGQGNALVGSTFNLYDHLVFGTPPEMELWVRDKENRVSICSTSIWLNDPWGSCDPPSGAPVTACSKTEIGEPISDMIYNFKWTHPGLPSGEVFATGNGNGCGVGYGFFASDLIVSLEKEINVLSGGWLNGITTYDLLLISRHILGVDTIDSPYKMIAADVNKSGSITTNDIVQLRKLILGILDTVLGNTSWRFVPQNFQFQNPINPFQPSFPETFQINALPSTVTVEFIGLKVGDVNGNASPGFLKIDDRSPQFFTLENQKLATGQTATIPIFSDEKSILAGFQMEFLTDPTAIEIEEILPGAATDFGRENYASAADGKVAVSWVSTENRDLKNSNSPLISLKIKALRDVSLSDVLKIDDSRLRPEAYFGHDEIRKIDLRFLEKNRVGEVFKIYPNPAADQLFFEFSNEKATPLSWQIFDLTGSEISRGESQNQPEKLDISNLPTGSFYLKINVGSEVFGKVFFKK